MHKIVIVVAFVGFSFMTIGILRDLKIDKDDNTYLNIKILYAKSNK